MLHSPNKLAINGGEMVRKEPFPAHRTIGDEERIAVNKVIDAGVLSNYLGAWHENFMGGEYVRACEEAWASFMGAKHALAVNSNTSGLIAAVGAAGVGPGDEVIVTAYSMSASATAPLFWGATPIFADVEADTFCLDVKSIESVITTRTKALIIVDIFGQPYNGDGVNALCKKHGITIIEDCAQAPGVDYNGIKAGLIGDIGVFSLNYHKHIHSGEGGIIVTNNDDLAERLALIRNHAESVVGPKGVTNLVNMIGFNFRMTEIEAAIATCQLKKLPGLLSKRLDNVSYFEKKMEGFELLTMPKVRQGATHAYYVHACLWNTDSDFERNSFIEAVKAELPHFHQRPKEGVKLGYGYVKPLYLLPAFKNRIAIGDKGFPLKDAWQNYGPGLCPIVEKLHYKTLVSHEFIVPSMTKNDIDDVVYAFEKVWDNRDQIT